jgi:hypothetical protein
MTDTTEAPTPTEAAAALTAAEQAVEDARTDLAKAEFNLELQRRFQADTSEWVMMPAPFGTSIAFLGPWRSVLWFVEQKLQAIVPEGVVVQIEYASRDAEPKEDPERDCANGHHSWSEAGFGPCTVCDEPARPTVSPEPDCSAAARDAGGNIRLALGHGELVASAYDTRAGIQSCLNEAAPGSKAARMFKAALALMDREDATAAVAVALGAPGGEE